MATTPTAAASLAPSRSDGSYVYLAQPSSSSASPSSSTSAANAANASAMSSTSTRPLILHAAATHAGPTVSIPVPVAPYEIWMSAQALKEQFTRFAPASSLPSTSSSVPALQADSDNDPSQDLGARAQAEKQDQIVLCANFMGFLADTINAARGLQAADVSPQVKVLQHVWFTFNASFLRLTPEGHTTRDSIDLHLLSSTLDADARAGVLRAYYDAYVLLDAYKNKDPSLTDIELATPMLLRQALNDQVKVFGVFGGQGTNEIYFAELQSLFDAYRPLVEPVVRDASVLLETLVDEARQQGFANFYSQGLDVAGWLLGTVAKPSTEYFVPAPVSLPLIGMTQLLQYLVVCRCSGLSPDTFRRAFVDATGHSQGIISAVVLSSSDTPVALHSNIVAAIRLLFHIGKRGQAAFPSTTLEPKLAEDSVTGGEGEPTPMLSVSGLDRDALEAHIAKTNSYLDADRHVAISLYNGKRNFTVTGFPRSLFGLVLSLREIRAAEGADQTKVPFSQRKPVFHVRFLPISVPYHSSYLAGVTDTLIEQDYTPTEAPFEPSKLAIRVSNTDTGSDLRTLPDGRALLRSLCDQIFTQPIHWESIVPSAPQVTHLLDFGTGGISGIGTLTSRNLEGKGVYTLVPSGRHSKSAEVYNLTSVAHQVKWADAYAPKLSRTREGRLLLDTPMSRVLGKPPLMVPGMTPTTVQAGFNVATMNAGYHIELAGGGHFLPQMLRDKVVSISEQTAAGEGLTLNALYINQRLWNIQFPQWLEMRREGFPLQGFTVAAGIPSPEKAKEIIDGLRAAGIEHISFKPGSTDGIKQVCSIAARNPDFPILLQWTGGRAGGHHSCEDFHQPILATYGRIRSCPNLVLVAGSGFGSAEDFWPYLTGDWSASEFGLEPMPFDGVLFGSWVMTAKEGHANDEIKQLMVNAAGVDDKQWEGTFTKPTGGVVTVTSELGEPIHKIATRGMKLWADLDKKCFTLPKEKRIAWLKQNKNWVIERLNADFQKPWFPVYLDGTSAQGVEDMTYEETIRRLLRLLYIESKGRWVDITLRNFMGDWLRRVEERFAGIQAAGQQTSLLQSYAQLDSAPAKFIDGFVRAYPDTREVLLSAEDVSYFIVLCNRPTQKPVPFIPLLDENLAVYFKKDSLSYSEDLDSIFDRDPQRVAILHGPVAARHNTRANVPIKEMLGGVEDKLVQLMLERYYDGDVSRVPVVDYLGKAPLSQDLHQIAASHGITVETNAQGVELALPTDAARLPEASTWFDALAGPEASWLRALLTSVSVVRGRSYVDNPIKRLLAPRANQVVQLTRNAGNELSQLTLLGSYRSYGPANRGTPIVSVTYDAQRKVVDVLVNEVRSGELVPLHFVFEYHPEQPYALIHESVDTRNRRIKEFYWKLWFHEDMPSTETLASQDVFVNEPKVLRADSIQKFCQVIGNNNVAYHVGGQAPMDFAIVAGWEAIMQALTAKIDGDLLNLVHLSNSFEMAGGASGLRVGDECQATAHVQSVKISPTGKTVAIQGKVMRRENSTWVPVIQVVSSFFYRGKFDDYATCFEHQRDRSSFDVKTKADAAVLMAKEWFAWTASAPLEPGTTLYFDVHNFMRYANANAFAEVKANGGVYIKDYKDDLVQVGQVEYEADSISYGNPVSEYIKRVGGSSQMPLALEHGYKLEAGGTSSKFVAPTTNEPYSVSSGDFNPIHINPYFADFAALPGTITHGLYSSAATRRFVEDVAGEGHPDRVLKFSASFVGMVLPGDELSVTLRHTAMHGGNKVIAVETVNQEGEKVLVGEAEVAQPPTAYVFTGQGSQEQGMGMDLYNSSDTARQLWDEADSHLRTTLGFSILEIVRDNPLRKTVHFGGVRGHAIRDRYMSMMYETTDSEGKTLTLPLFPEISLRSQSFTFQSPKGLLYATQFAQIALVLVELSAYRDMKQRGLIRPDSAFAGHSLGEYASLAAVASVLQVKDLVDVVFYRGLTMQRAVGRDAEGRSSYGMMACNPQRVGPSFSDVAFAEVVESISRVSGKLVQTVNYNVSGQQLVVAGELVALLTMTNVLNFIKMQRIDLNHLLATMSPDAVRAQLAEIVAGVYAEAEKEAAKGPLQLQRGFATIPLPGIDVPFHSRYLMPGVAPFRAYLSKRINVDAIRPNLLVGKYIPNLIARPFELTKEYAEVILNQTGSGRLAKVVKDWEKEGWASPEREQRLTTLLVVELLAYQFASPVQWIKTQELLFGQPYQMERMVEFGPSPTLVGMAVRTHKTFHKDSDEARGLRRELLCSSKDKEALYYSFADVEADEPPAQEAAPAASAPVAAPAVAPAAVPAPAAAGPAQDVPDEPVKAVETLTAILAQKLKKPLDSIPKDKAIKEMVGGKSTMQNEIVSSLIDEFGGVPDRGEELPVDELASALQVGYKGAMGKYTLGLVSRFVAAKMPGGFNLSSVKSHLSKSWGLGQGRTESVLLAAVADEPPKRLGSEGEAKAWLDAVVTAYGKRSGVSLSQGGAPGAGGGGGASGGVAISSEELDKLREGEQQHARRQIQLLQRYLGQDARAEGRATEAVRTELEQVQAELDAIAAEHGELYTNGIRPRFDARKVRTYSSSWNWSRQQALLLYYDIIKGRLGLENGRLTALKTE